LNGEPGIQRVIMNRTVSITNRVIAEISNLFKIYLIMDLSI
jgi:hypothetical protein